MCNNYNQLHIEFDGFSIQYYVYVDYANTPHNNLIGLELQRQTNNMCHSEN